MFRPIEEISMESISFSSQQCKVSEIVLVEQGARVYRDNNELGAIQYLEIRPTSKRDSS
jgi:hypothetical protein